MVGLIDEQIINSKEAEYLRQPNLEVEERVSEDPTYHNSIREAFFMELPSFSDSQDAYSIRKQDVPDMSPSAEYISQDSSNNDQNDWDAKERKRARNRAAQKAFRERREAKMKELEEKLRESEENRRALNEKIKSLQQSLKQDHSYNTAGAQEQSPVTYTFPTSREFYDQLVAQEIHGEYKLNTQHYYDDSGAETLPIAATWEYLHTLSAHKEFDIHAVMKKLKGNEVCHGHGASYSRSLIDRVVEESQCQW